MADLDTDQFVSNLTGLTILGGEMHEGEGFHFHLSDGRTLVIVGSFVLGLTRLEDITIQ